ncbi:RNA methyltransferase [Desertihabitans brevis]|uniref:RNA methyltransferase n=1 Tax=Desertihabitans brevis TaxID=2268447 RepID=A0A367YT55_9ACTN|nr:RNA methyltransferase [Desertihabitans brevis]RCK68212.1 RNA methyltransferase [Desertihabitans brevis]
MSEPTVTPQGWRSARRLRTRKHRLAERRWLVEGPQAVGEAVAAGVVRRLFATPDAAGRHPGLVADARASGAAVTDVTPDQLSGLVDTVTPQGVAAVCDAVDVPLPDALGETPRLVVVCARIRDPGNAGTVIRCADAFGADAVVLTDSSVELGNPKVLRASVGSVFHLPVTTGASLEDVVAACRARGLQVLAADGGAPEQLDALATRGALARPTAWMMGNEAWGLPAEDAALADARVGVPLWGAAESLNLATAAAVCLYTTAAAQRAGGG